MKYCRCKKVKSKSKSKKVKSQPCHSRYSLDEWSGPSLVSPPRAGRAGEGCVRLGWKVRQVTFLVKSIGYIWIKGFTSPEVVTKTGRFSDTLKESLLYLPWPHICHRRLVCKMRNMRYVVPAMTSYWRVESPSRQWAAVRTHLSAMIEPPQKWEMLARKFLNETLGKVVLGQSENYWKIKDCSLTGNMQQ